MDPATVAMAHRAADRTWRGVRSAPQATFDQDDLRQEALILAWRWEGEFGYGESYSENLLRYAYFYVVRRLVDYMRAANPTFRRKHDRTYRTIPVVSLDEPLLDGRLIGDVTPDPASEDPYAAVEDEVDIRRAFESWDGPSRHAEVAWLSLQGLTLAEIGATFGFTESRASQLRKSFVTVTARRWTESESEPDAA